MGKLQQLTSPAIACHAIDDGGCQSSVACLALAKLNKTVLQMRVTSCRSTERTVKRSQQAFCPASWKATSWHFVASNQSRPWHRPLLPASASPEPGKHWKQEAARHPRWQLCLGLSTPLGTKSQ